MSKLKRSNAPKPRLSFAMTKDQVNAKYNPSVVIPMRIKAALKELGDAACTAKDFAAMTKIGSPHIAQFQELFSEYIVTVREGGRERSLWCGTPKFAQELRESLTE